MGDIGASLQRKLGPLPVWAWALIVGVALYWYRQHHSSGSGGGASAAAAAQQQYNQSQVPPQAPQVLGPGESVYDPNTGALVGGSNNGNNLGPSLIGLIAALLQPKPTGKHPHTKKHHRHHVHKKPPKPHRHIHKHPGKSHTHPKHGAGSRRNAHHVHHAHGGHQ